MSDQIGQVRKFLQASGMIETLQALERESMKNSQRNNQFMNFTFEKLPSMGNVAQASSGIDDRQMHSGMVFESPMIKNDNEGRKGPGLFNPYMQSSGPFSNHSENDPKKKEEDTFSFGEECSDNEVTPKSNMAGGRAQNVNFAQQPGSQKMKSENFIKINRTSIGEPVPQPRMTPPTYNFNNPGVFATAPSNIGNPLQQGHPGNKRMTAEMADNEFNPSGLSNYRPRSIQSRSNSREREGYASFQTAERNINFIDPVTIAYADQCQLTRHRGLQLPSTAKHPSD